MKTTAVILAAGQGTRMRSDLPKVLHPLGGRPMIWHALEAAREGTETQPVVVVGTDADAIRQAVGEAARFVVQETQLGTGHAVQQAEALLKGQADLVLVINADLPLLTGQTLRRLVESQRTHAGAVTLLTVQAPDPRGFGRVLRDANQRILGVVEEAQASAAQLDIQELNVGAYCFAASWLWGALSRIQLSPKGEYYLTDLIEIAVSDGRTVEAVQLEDPRDAIGVNNRVHLAEAEAALRDRTNRSWMLAGVTLVDPSATYIDLGVTIGQDTVIWPNTYLQGDTRVGQGCTLGPNTVLRDTQIGDRCTVLASVLEGALLEDEVEIGPFGRLRKGAHLAQGVHLGNFGEVKNAYLGPGVKMGHFSYIGDAHIGANVNIGAGTVTCNYDGRQKHHTEIGEAAFIGSDTMLVAPVKVGAGANTGAGAVVTRDIPEHSLAVGAPARVVRKLDQND